MHVHQETVDSYLEDIIMESIGQISCIQAREQVQDYARKIDLVTEHLHKT